MILVSNITGNLAAVRQSVARAALAAGRKPEDVTIVAVSKNHTVDEIRAALAAGVTHLGENRVQEAAAKHAELGAAGLTWHLIGSLQTNKAKQALAFADLIHSVDRPELAFELHRQAERLGRSIDCLIQVNTSLEDSKHGFTAEGTLPFLREAGRWGSLRIVGLMTMAPPIDDPEQARPYFRQLRQLAEQAADLPGVQMRWLSMGMSGDYEAAIMEGANLVRIGTAIFGPRAYPA